LEKQCKFNERYEEKKELTVVETQVVCSEMEGIKKLEEMKEINAEIR
jgi:hypothetical protein